MFFDCQSPPIGKDSNYWRMKQDIEEHYQTEFNYFSESHFHKLYRAKERVLLEYIARRIHLLLLLRKNSNLTPQQYLETQLSSVGIEAIAKIVNYLKSHTWKRDSIIEELDKDFKNFQLHDNIIAIDEAEAALETLGEKIVSELALSRNEIDLYSGTPVPLKLRRGLLGAMLSALYSIYGKSKNSFPMFCFF